MRAVIFILLNVSLMVKAPESTVSTIEIETIMNNMFNSIDNIKTLKFELMNSERINGRLMTGKQRISLEIKPFICYLEMISPNPKAELLYVDGENEGKAIYEPNGWPYFRMSLDPNGFLMRKNNHHTIFEAGFGYIGRITKELFANYPSNFKLVGPATWNDRKGYTVEAEVDGFRYIKYTVLENEDIVKIARKFHLSEYMIVEINDDVDDYLDVTPDQQINLPTFYAGKMIIFIDEENWLPVLQTIYDNKGLYEMYAYSWLETNPDIPSHLFTQENLGKKAKNGSNRKDL